MERVLDIAIIGGGPAGLSAAVNARARGKTVLVITRGASLLEKAPLVENHLGQAGVSGGEMMRSFREHAARAGAEFLEARAVNAMALGDRFMVNADNTLIEAHALILCTGAALFRPLAGEEALLGSGVSYCATCDGMLYRGKRAAVIGFSETAPEEANFLQGIGVEVVYIAAGNRPQRLREEIRFISDPAPKILGESAVAAIAAAGAQLPVEAAFVLRDAIAPASLLYGLQIEKGYITVNRKMETNLEGVFAAGDCTGPPLQVSKAVGEGLIAAQEAARFLDRKKNKE